MKTKQQKKDEMLKGIQALSVLATKNGAETGHWLLIELRKMYKRVSEQC